MRWLLLKLALKSNSSTCTKASCANTQHFFQDAFSGDFAGSHVKSIRLKDTNVDVFNIFKNWLYRIILLPLSDYPDHPTNDEDDNLRICSLLCRAWVYGDAIVAPCFKNAVMDEFSRRCKLGEGMSLAPYIYANTVAMAPPRILITDRTVSMRRGTLLG
jgi:hypothetical protein